MSRPYGRILTLATAAAVAALSACSAGQVTQTSTQVATVNGASANVGPLSLRNISLAYPPSGTYSAGSSASLLLVITNQSLAQDMLIDVTGDFFSSAAVPAGDPSGDSTGTASGTSTAAPTSGSDEPLRAAVPAQSIVQFGTNDFPAIELSELSEELSVAQIVSITFVFEMAGEVTVEVPVGNSTRELDRDEGFDFHPEEGSGG
ncbi:MAG: hypothetical protein WKF51_08230 [Geodermatophilaceae bacterium]